METILLGLPVPEVRIHQLLLWSPEQQIHASACRSGASFMLDVGMYKERRCVQVWVHEQADGRLDIVDGKQRITSLLSFLDGIFPRNQQRFNLEACKT